MGHLHQCATPIYFSTSRVRLFGIKLGNTSSAEIGYHLTHNKIASIYKHSFYHLHYSVKWPGLFFLSFKPISDISEFSLKRTPVEGTTRATIADFLLRPVIGCLNLSRFSRNQPRFKLCIGKAESTKLIDQSSWLQPACQILLVIFASSCYSR